MDGVEEEDMNKNVGDKSRGQKLETRDSGDLPYDWL